MKLDTVIDDIVERTKERVAENKKVIKNTMIFLRSIQLDSLIKQLSLIFLNVYKILFFQASLEEKVLKVIMLNII